MQSITIGFDKSEQQLRYSSLNLRFFQVFVRQLNKGKYYLSLALYCIDAISITRICLTTSNKEMILITGFVRFYTSTFFNIQQYARTGDLTSNVKNLTREVNIFSEMPTTQNELQAILHNMYKHF